MRIAKGFTQLRLILLAYTAFIALGMRDGLLGVAWPTIRADFSLPLDSVGILLLAAVSGYMTASFMIGTLIARMGVGKLMLISFVLTSSSLIAFTLVPAWWMMVLLSVIGGLGAGGIDAGLNTYVAAHFGEGSMQWLHASYGIGITMGPLVMTVALTTLNSWRIGYQAVGGFHLALMAVVVVTLPWWRQSVGIDEPRRLTDYKTPMGETLRQPGVWLSALLFFIYVGAEMSLGTWTYSLLIESRGISPAVAGIWAGSYWATFTVGRILAGLYAKRVGIHLLIQASLLGALIGTVLLVWNPSNVANVVAVAVIGFSTAPIFPALMSGTSQRVGVHFAANTIGMQMAATGLGTAVIPGLLGVLARRFSLEVIPVCLLVVFLALFGFYRLSMRTKMEFQEHKT